MRIFSRQSSTRSPLSGSSLAGRFFSAITVIFDRRRSCRLSTSDRNANTHSLCTHSIAHFGSFDDSFRKRRTVGSTVKTVVVDVFSTGRSSLSLSSDVYNVGFYSTKIQKVLKCARYTYNTIRKMSRYASRYRNKS